MKLPRFLANIVRPGASPELVTRRNFDDLADTLATSFGYIEAEFAAIAGSISSKAEIDAMIRRWDFANVKWFGAKGAGATETEEIQRGIDAAEAVGAALYFPPTAAGYRCGRIHINTGWIKIFGNNTKMVQIYDAEEGSDGPGSTKVSPIFFCTKTSAHIEITGFHFTTDDSTFPIVPGWYSYLSVICVNRSDYVNVHHCTFAGGQQRALFLYGGKYCSVKDCEFINNSMVFHIGIEENENFWDSSDSYATIYGPVAPTISDNRFIGFDIENICLFISGPNDFTITGNKFIDLNNVGGNPVRLYVNDQGMYDGDGNNLDTQSGLFADNTIRGTFENGLQIFGQAGIAPMSLLTFNMRIKVENNTIEGDGVGIELERVYGLRVLNNDIRTTNTPLYVKRELVDCKIIGNHLECADQSTIVPAIESTLVFDTNAVIMRTEMSGNEIVTPAADIYTLLSAGGVLFRDFTFKKNTIKFNSTAANPRAFQFNHTGVLDFSENEFYIDSSSFTDKHIAAINIAISAWNDNQGYNPGYTVIPTTPNGFQYRVVSPVGDTGATEPTWPTTIGDTVVDNEVTWVCEARRARAIINKNRVLYANAQNRGIDILSNSVYFSENIDFEMATLAGTDVYCAGNRIESREGSTTAVLLIENSGHAHVAGNYVKRPFELNSVVVSFESVTNSKMLGNYIEGFSTGALVRATAVGRLEHMGDTIVNNGAGGIGHSVTLAATARSMTQDSKGANVTAANDLTLGMDGTYFEVDGSTQINGIATAGWQAGERITLEFVNAPTVKHNTAASAGFASLQLAGAVDFVATAGDTLTLRYDGTYWRQVSSAVI